MARQTEVSKWPVFETAIKDLPNHALKKVAVETLRRLPPDDRLRVVRAALKAGRPGYVVRSCEGCGEVPVFFKAPNVDSPLNQLLIMRCPRCRDASAIEA